MRFAGGGGDAVADEGGFAVFNQLESVDAEELLGCEGGRGGFGVVDECGGGRVRGEEVADCAAADGAEEFEEALARAHGEEGGGVGDDVSVHAVAFGVETEVEAGGEAMRVGVGVVVGDDGDAGAVGEAAGYGGGGIVEVFGTGEGGGFRGGCEGAREEDASSVRRTEAGWG